MKKLDSERIAVIENEIKNINGSIDEHKKEQRIDFNLVFEKIDTIDAKLDTKFAGKWVEKVTIGVLVTFLASLAVGITMFIITGAI